MQGESFADDLVVGAGSVSVRVALLLRCAELHPVVALVSPVILDSLRVWFTGCSSFSLGKFRDASTEMKRVENGGTVTS